MALAGTIIGAIFTLLIPLLAIPAAIMFPVFAKARASAQQVTCLSNVKQLGTAMSMYASDWDDRYPLADNWNEALAPYAKDPENLIICPAAESKDEPSYAMNGQLSGFPERSISSPADIVMLYDSVPGRNRSGGPELLPSPPRHTGDNNTVGFVDGHVKSVERSDTSALKWSPYDALTYPAPW